MEKPVARLVRDPRFNPFYHTGTITVFLLLVIRITGIYLTMFYQFGFAGSYRAVANIEASPVGRVIRALHRYASDLAVIFSAAPRLAHLLHGSLPGAAVAGVGHGGRLAAVTWVIGVTGYWLISDERAQLLNGTLAARDRPCAGRDRVPQQLPGHRCPGRGLALTLILIVLHVGLSSIVGLFFWLHIRRLSRAKWLPPRFWLALARHPAAGRRSPCRWACCPR